jgi:hypothetical protein
MKVCQPSEESPFKQRQITALDRLLGLEDKFANYRTSITALKVVNLMDTGRAL